jgi:hypothetical protein
MAELFNSYQTGNAIFCDITPECIFPEPNSRVLCSDLKILCGGSDDCSFAIVNNGLILCDCSDSWNCNLCANDSAFWIPFESGDSFDFQFQQPYQIKDNSKFFGWTYPGLQSPLDEGFCSFEIYSCCNDEPIRVSNEETFDSLFLDAYVGTYSTSDYSGAESTNSIQQIRFDLDAIANLVLQQTGDNCFYFKFCFATSAVPLPYAFNRDQVVCFCSEPFKAIPCSNGKKSILVESLYPSKDCFGLYYGTNYSAYWGAPFQYSNAIRVPGSFEQDNFDLQKQVVNTSLKTTASQICENWTLRSNHAPQRFVKLLVTIFAGRDVYIGGKEYQVQGEISKNNEIGSHWFIEAKAERCNCSQSLNCK